MMQSCASAAKLRSGGPILPIGMKAKGHVGIPPPRTIIGAPSQANGQDRNCRGAFSILHSLCRTQNDTVRYNALPNEPPQGDVVWPGLLTTGAFIVLSPLFGFLRADFAAGAVLVGEGRDGGDGTGLGNDDVAARHLEKAPASKWAQF